MKTPLPSLAIVIGLALSCFVNSRAQTQPPASTNDYHRWWNDQNPGSGRRGGRGNAQTPRLPLIRVQGNKFVDPDGKTILFRGVSIADPDKIEHQGHWNKDHFQKVKDLGATLVRIPVHPIAWRERPPAAYLRLLDQAVGWCSELDMHVIIDWHSIGNLQMEMFQDPMYNTTKKETFDFWRVISQHFAGNTTVAFYELFNEPTIYRGQLGSMSWSEWKKLNEQMIGIIRAFDKQKIPLVAGLDWAYDLTPLHIDPIQAEGIGYTTHPYSNKRTEPWPPKWEEDFGFAAADYPIIATEFGFSVRNGATPGPNEYPNQIINYLEGKGISWTAWVYDPEWGPSLLNRGDDYTLNGAGEFIKSVLQSKMEKPAAPPAAAADVPK